MDLDFHIYLQHCQVADAGLYFCLHIESTLKTYNESRTYNLNLRVFQEICSMKNNSTDSVVAQPPVMKIAATGEQMKKLAVPVS